MSKVKIQGNSSGTGIFTIEAPNSNTDRTLTLPDNAGEVLTNASSLSAANLAGSLPAIDGSALTGLTSSDILNVYSNKILTDLEVGNGTRYTWLQAEITVTPTSISSAFLLQLDAPAWSTTSATYGNLGFYKVINGTTTEIPTGTWVARLYLLAGGEARNVYHHVNAQFWDQPGTTNPVTYKIYLERAGGSDSVAVGGQNTSIPSNFTIYELSGATLLTDGV